MEKKLKNVLEEIGLSQKEALVYITMIKTGHTSLLKIAQSAEIKRSGLYNIIDSLQKKELVQVAFRGRKKIYLPVEPDLLLEMISRKKRDLLQALPNLKELYRKGSYKPAIKYYEGKEEVRNAIKPFIKSKNEILWFGSDIDFETEFPEFHHRTYNYAKKNDDFSGYRALYNYNKRNKDLSSVRNKDKESKMQRRLIRKDLYFKDSVNIIYDDKLLIISLKTNYFAIEVDSKTVSDAYRLMFEMAWNSAIKP